MTPQTDIDQQLLDHAERQTEAIGKIKDAVQVLMWVAIIGLATGLIVAFN